MINTTLTGTWIDSERELREGDVLAKSDADVLLSVPANGGWQRYGTMWAYGDVAVGSPMRLVSKGSHENLNADNVASAYRDGDGFVVTTSHGHKFRVETYDETGDADRPSPVTGIVSYVRKRFGI